MVMEVIIINSTGYFKRLETHLLGQKPTCLLIIFTVEHLEGDQRSGNPLFLLFQPCPPHICSR